MVDQTSILAACAVIVAVGSALVVITKAVKIVWRTIRRLGLVADQWLGDKDRGMPSMLERMVAVERKLDELSSPRSQPTTGHGRPAQASTRPQRR